MLTKIVKLAEQIHSGQVGQCWICHGLLPCEQIRQFAEAVFCPERCGVCQSCQLFQMGEHPDYHLLEPAENQGIHIDSVRSMISSVKKQSYTSRHLVVISQAQLLNDASCHALLKTLEESQFVWFILFVNNVDEVLPTIRSRCQIISQDDAEAIDVKQIELFENGINQSPSSCIKLWSKHNLTPEQVLSCALYWCKMQYMKQPSRHQWCDLFDKLVHWQKLHQQKNNMTYELMLERIIHGCLSMLYICQLDALEKKA